MIILCQAINSETHEEVISKNLTKFCRDYNLNHSCISDVLNGRLKSYHNWTLKRI